jgi:hypothetical protein
MTVAEARDIERSTSSDHDEIGDFGKSSREYYFASQFDEWFYLVSISHDNEYGIPKLWDHQYEDHMH